MFALEPAATVIESPVIPLPLSVQLVTFCADHWRLVWLPLRTRIGVAFKEIVGVAGHTVTADEPDALQLVTIVVQAEGLIVPEPERPEPGGQVLVHEES